MTRASGFQLPFEFEQSRRSDPSPEMPSERYETLMDDITASEISISRFTRVVKEDVVISVPHDAADYLMNKVYVPFEAFDQEEIHVLLLNTRNRITHDTMVYRGTVNSIHIRQAELFKAAIRFNSTGMLLSHIHPSGDPTPSPEDVRVTEETVTIAKMLGILLLDHIVIGKDRWISLKERRLGFST